MTSNANFINVNDIVELKKSIMDAINDDTNIGNLYKLLNPITIYVDHHIFIENLKQVVEVVMEDRDGNNKFTIRDLELLQTDIIAIGSLINALLLVLGSIPDLKIKYESGGTERMVFKLLIYVFLIIIPQDTGQQWTLREKESVVTLTVSIYHLMVTSNIVSELMTNIINWFKKKGFCSCVSSIDNVEHREAVVDRHLPGIKEKVRTNAQKNKERIRMQQEIDMLKLQLKRVIFQNGNGQKLAESKVNVGAGTNMDGSDTIDVVL